MKRFKYKYQDDNPNFDSLIKMILVALGSILLSMNLLSAQSDLAPVGATVTKSPAASDLDLGPDLTHCGGYSSMLNAGAGYVSYNWSNGSHVQSFQAAVPGSYWVEVVDITGLSMRDTIEVFVQADPIPDFYYSIFDEQFHDNSQFAAKWTWDFGDGHTSIEQNPDHTYAVPGLYEVCLAAESHCANKTICLYITVAPAKKGVIEEEINSNSMEVYPNPSIGGQFTIKLEGNIDSVEKIRILNIQGKPVHELNNIPMNGHLNMELNTLPAGVYFVQAFYKDNKLTKRLFISR